MKIDINIKDWESFYDVASFVDQDTFLNELQNLRKKYQLSEELKGRSNIKNGIALCIKETKEIRQTEKALMKKRKQFEPQEFMKKNHEFQKMRTKLLRKYYPSAEYDYSIRDILKQFKKPSYFLFIIKAAVERNVVDEDDYLTNLVVTPGDYQTLIPDELDEEISNVPSSMVISIYPTTTENQVLSMFRYAKKEMGENVYVPKKKKGQIKLHRNIYWFWKEKYSNKAITDWEVVLNEWLNECPKYKNGEIHADTEECVFCENSDIDEKTFKDAIDEYKNWLKHFTS